MRRRRFWLTTGALCLVVFTAWLAWSVTYPVPEIRVGMAEREVEARLGQPDTRTHDEGHSGVGVYPAVPRWVLGRHDYYIVTFGTDGRVASYDLVENNFRGSRWTHG